MDDGNSTQRGAAEQDRTRLVWRGSMPLVAVDQGNVTTLYRVTLVPDGPREDPLGRLEMVRNDLFSTLAAIHGADAVSDLFTAFDQVIADLRQELTA